MTQHLVGHNIISFDLPYLKRSANYNGVKTGGFATGSGKGRWPNCYLDTMVIDGANTYGHRISLDRLAKIYGVGSKEGKSGKDFYKFERHEQEAYLENDLHITRKVFEAQNHSEGLSDEYTIFDIETGPKPTAEILELSKKFNPEDVKTGNIKDPYKKADKIEQAREDHFNSIVGKAALDPSLSNVVAIGYIHSNGSIELDFGEPKKLLTRFWEVAGNIAGNESHLNTIN